MKVSVYVCMYVCPCRARKYDQNGPYILTYMGRCRFKKGRFFHVCLLLPMQAEEKGPSIHTYISNIHYEGPHTYIHTSTQTNLQLVDSVFAYIFGQKTWPWPSKLLKLRFLGNPEISISMAGTTFFDKNVKKTSKKQMEVSVYVCMYVCMYVCPCRARKYDQNGPYIHTWADAVSKRVDFSCMFTFAHAGRGKGPIHTYIHFKHTFQTYIYTNAHSLTPPQKG